MSENIRDHMTKRCIHFRSIFDNDTCNAGIKYDDVKVDKPYKFPCLQQGGVCNAALFPTKEEVDAMLKNDAQRAQDALVMMSRVRQHYIRTMNATDIIGCVCGGEMTYSVSSVNGHVLAHCSMCHMAFME